MTTTPKQKLVGAVIVGAALCPFLLSSPEAQIETHVRTVVAARAQPVTRATPLRPIARSLTVTETSAVPTACAEEWAEMTRLDLVGALDESSAQSGFYDLRPPRGDVIAEALERWSHSGVCRDLPAKHPLSAYQQQLAIACGDDQRGEDGAMSPLCFSKFLILRFHIVDHQTKHLDLHEIDDDVVLQNKYMANFFDFDRGPNIDMLEQIAARLQEITTGPESLELGLKTLMLAAQEVGPEGIDRERFEMLSNGLAAMTPNNPLLIESKLSLALRAQDADVLSRAIEEAVASHPKSSLPYYYEAWAAIRVNDKASAIASLERGLAAIPGDSTLASTLHSLAPNAEHHEAEDQDETTLFHESTTLIGLSIALD